MELKKTIARIKNGDQEAWSMIVDKYSKTIYNMALNFAKNRDDAADITQDIFIKVFKNIGKFSEDGNFSSWVMRISKNHCIDYWRKNKKNSQVLELNDQIRIDDSNSEEKLINKMDLVKLRQKISRLEPDLRILLVLRDIQSYSYQEISEQLDLPLGTVKSRINRARVKLARDFFWEEH